MIRETNGSGVKHDGGKLPLDLLPFDAIEEVARVMDFGAQKYARRNWEGGMSWGRLFAAALRHLFSFWRGQDRDPETGLSHLAHATTCCLFLLAYSLRGAGADDRPSEGDRPEPHANDGDRGPRDRGDDGA